MYNRWISSVAYEYKKTPSELLEMPWSHFLLMALPLEEHKCERALWDAIAAHAPQKLGEMKEKFKSQEEKEAEYAEGFAKLKRLAAKGGVLI